LKESNEIINILKTGVIIAKHVILSDDSASDKDSDDG
jgi:hypothetical protein